MRDVHFLCGFAECVSKKHEVIDGVEDASLVLEQEDRLPLTGASASTASYETETLTFIMLHFNSLNVG